MHTATRPLILVVDDERDVSELIGLTLEGAGFDVITAATGRQALAAVGSNRFDLILLDVMLPDIDGFGVCEILRGSKDTTTIPIIMSTACNSPDAHTVGRDLGANDYIDKPFDPQELIARIRNILSKPVAKIPARKKKSSKSTADSCAV